MPSRSIRQRRYFGAIQGGAIPRPKGMTDQTVHDFASTSEKGLPETAPHMADGGTAPGDPLDFSDKFNSAIPDEKQAAYSQWHDALPKQLQSSRDYDLQGAFLNGTSADFRDHMTDQFKKPNHVTFSDQSVYSGRDGNTGGTWLDATTNGQKGKGFFQPSATNQKYRSPVDLQKYFADPRNGDTNITPLPALDIHPPKVEMQRRSAGAGLRRRYFGQ